MNEALHNERTNEHQNIAQIMGGKAIFNAVPSSSVCTMSHISGSVWTHLPKPLIAWCDDVWKLRHFLSDARKSDNYFDISRDTHAVAPHIICNVLWHHMHVIYERFETRHHYSKLMPVPMITNDTQLQTCWSVQITGLRTLSSYSHSDYYLRDCCG